MAEVTASGLPPNAIVGDDGLVDPIPTIGVDVVILGTIPPVKTSDGGSGLGARKRPRSVRDPGRSTLRVAVGDVSESSMKASGVPPPCTAIAGTSTTASRIADDAVDVLDEYRIAIESVRMFCDAVNCRVLPATVASTDGSPLP